MAGSKLSSDVYDVAVIGGGPAALTAGLYLSRGGMKAVLVESLSIMGQATMTATIENYPGISSIGGFDLLMTMKKQAESFGLEPREGTVREVVPLDLGGIPGWKVLSENGEYKALAVIAATGARPRKLGIPGEDRFCGSGVSYCATCDGAFFKGKNIAVIGGGDAAVEEACYLTRFAEKVTIVHRRDRLRAVKAIQDRAFSNKKISFIWSSVPEEIAGGVKVESLRIKNVKTGEASAIPCDGVFIFIGWEPNTDFIKKTVNTSENGRVLVDANMRTSSDGIFAAGDCCEKLLYQVVTACGDGATAAYAAQHYAESLKGTAYD